MRLTIQLGLVLSLKQVCTYMLYMYHYMIHVFVGDIAAIRQSVSKTPRVSPLQVFASEFGPDQGDQPPYNIPCILTPDNTRVDDIFSTAHRQQNITSLFYLIHMLYARGSMRGKRFDIDELSDPAQLQEPFASVLYRLNM